MSHDATLTVESKTASGRVLTNTVCDINLTYNYQPAIAAAGLDSFSALSGMTGQKAAVILGRVSKNLESHPEYGNLIRGGGTWGTLGTLTEALERMLQASKEWPEGTWRVI